VNKNFWKSKQVFVTGHTGFKGAWLCLWLQRLGAKVTGFSLPPPTNPSLFEVAEVGDGMSSVIGDIRDLSQLRNAIKAQPPDVLFHMAAQSLVRRSYAEPIDTYSTNVMGTAHVLEAIRGLKTVRAVVIVTSDKCYENREWVWGYRENDRLGGYDPYASSKACAELVTAAYRRSFFSDDASGRTSVATVRAGNVIGGGDWAEDRLIPDAVRAFCAKRELLIRSPEAVRPWQFVLEPLCGYLMLAEKLSGSGRDHADAWNFGPSAGSVATVEEVATILSKRWGEQAGWKAGERSKLKETRALNLDSSKSNTLIEWIPVLSLQDTLEWTVEWYKSWHAGARMRMLSESQIQRYAERLGGDMSP
jgi:CDP-glucose 4,6-dehydratase